MFLAMVSDALDTNPDKGEAKRNQEHPCSFMADEEVDAPYDEATASEGDRAEEKAKKY